MRLRRRAAAPPPRRTRLQSDDLTPPPPAFSYRARRSERARNLGRELPADPAPTSTGRAATGRFWLLQRFGLVVLLVAVVVSAVNVLTLSSDAKIMPLTDSGNQSLLRPSAAYQTAVDHQLSRSVWNHNKITIDTGQLSRQLLAQFPELSSVSITVPLLGHRPVVYVEPARPALILVSGSRAFVIDSGGKALLSAATPAALNQPNLPVLTDQSGLTIQLNHQVLATTSVSFIQTVIAELAAKQFTVSALTLPPAADELDVHLAGQPYYVKFNLQSNNPKGEAGTFLATITQLRRQNITPSQYVDVRVDGRAYYQ